MIYCRTLGTAEITVDGNLAPPQLNWRKHLALLIYLGRSPRLRRSRDHLVGLLWPDKSETAARHSLNEAIRVIRRAGGDDSLISETGQVRLAPSTVDLDIDQLVRKVASKDWTGASELVTGEFLEGFSIPEASEFEDWLTAERRHWKRTSLEVLVQRGEQLLELGHAEEAVKLADRAWYLDAASEVGARFSLRALAMSGHRAAALERYDAFVAQLKDMGGAEPDKGLRELARRLKDNRLNRPVPPAERDQRDSRLAPFIGRDRELGELLALWRRTRDEGAMAACVFGDPGLGKSRLMEELVLRVVLDGASVSHARAVESDRDQSWMGLRALVRGGMIEFPGVAGGPAEAHASLGRLAGEWLERYPSANDGTEMPVPQALTEILRVSTDDRPVLIVADDAQWLDHESLLAMDALLRDLKACPLMLVIAASSQPPRVELESLAEKIGRDTRGSVLTLAPLGEPELAGLARWWLPRFTAAEIDRVARRVAADSAGQPLLAVELFRAVALGMDLHQLEAWPQPSRTLDHTLPAELPPSVVAAIRVSFRRLSPKAQAVLSTASALPEPVSAARLVQLTGLAQADVNASLDELEWHRWVVAEARGYSFVARIVRATIARDMLTEGQRRRIRTL